MDTEIKKRRGRKPKSCVEDHTEVEKKKRGRKKKYEIENFSKLNNRNEINNFDHNIAYSDDDTQSVIEEPNKSIKKVAFGNLDITISKSIQEPDEDYKSIIQPQTQLIDEDEWESCSDYETETEKVYKEKKKYIPANTVTKQSNEESVKRIRIVTTVKNYNQFDTSWPETSDIHCWWCCHKFTCCPCTLPTKYDQLRKRFTFTGIFCSWNCVKAYNFEKGDHLKYQRSELITLLIKQMYGITKSLGIKPAPPRQCLKIFGGYLTIDEFRNGNSNVESYKINLLNYNYTYPEVTEVTSIKSKTVHKNLRIQRL
jgi:hypothetical protein